MNSNVNKKSNLKNFSDRKLIEYLVREVIILREKIEQITPQRERFYTLSDFHNKTLLREEEDVWEKL